MAAPPLMPVTLSCNTDLRFIELIQMVGTELLKQTAFTQDDSDWIWLAIQEGVSNAMHHGNKMDVSKKIQVTFAPSPHAMEIRIDDEGSGVDLDIVPNPNLSENLLKPRGRGVHFMKQTMDTVEMERRPDGSTLILGKKAKVAFSSTRDLSWPFFQ